MCKPIFMSILVNPRGQMERIQAKMTKEDWQMAKRAEGAHNNGIETLPVFYGAVVSVQFIFSLTTKQETSLRNTTTFQKENSVSQDGHSLRRHFATRNEFLKRLFGSRNIFLALRKFVTHTTQPSGPIDQQFVFFFTTTRGDQDTEHDQYKGIF